MLPWLPNFICFPHNFLARLSRQIPALEDRINLITEGVPPDPPDDEEMADIEPIGRESPSKSDVVSEKGVLAIPGVSYIFLLSVTSAKLSS